MELELSLKRIFKALDESSFVEVEGFWAQLEALKALDKLQTRAQKAGLSIEIVSAFRPFLYQAKIIEAKFTGERKVLDKNEREINIKDVPKEQRLDLIGIFSALAGLSRHHLGCDFDIYSKKLLPLGQNLKLEISEYQKGGYFAPLSSFLEENLESCGFYLPYRGQGKIAFEPWHISYKSKAQALLASFSLESLQEELSKLEFNFASYAQDYAKKHYKEVLAFDF